jgi:hypothetical protein
MGDTMIFPENPLSYIIQFNKGDVVTWSEHGQKIKAKITAVYENKFPYENQISYMVEGINKSLISHCDTSSLTR